MCLTNAIAIHGGGLVDSSKDVISRLMDELHEREAYKDMYLGKYSFESLCSGEVSFWIKYNSKKMETIRTQRGTALGTCRGIDLTEQKLFERTVDMLNRFGTKTIIVLGGDGSSRQVAEICRNLEKRGINIIFPIPLTIDGINGGLSIGLEQAVRESMRQIENITATSLETRDNGKFGVVMVELQGRNRDDIIANVAREICRQKKVADCNLENLLFRVVPANYETNAEKLISEINGSDERTLVLVSEGANIKIPELTQKINRKVRSLVVGHCSQSNGMTTEEDMQKYSLWISDAASIITEDPKSSYCIVNDGISCYKEPIDYYAKLNPREGQKAELSKGLKDILMKYMAK